MKTLLLLPVPGNFNCFSLFFSETVSNDNHVSKPVDATIRWLGCFTVKGRSSSILLDWLLNVYLTASRPFCWGIRA